ncbi:MAG: hypothetical protein GWO16_06720 [Gammaproteobacteria bacterium]|nr:hypothetical protein [Gammaproteobacteria bacterium]NIT63388.1 hypothetical protein [Gammaproteobacteria bacterium]NIX10195.1 hypothetical protein [Gammaproteobacteria bacterium]NIY31968.1 hypothetical protein [Gammaproteobacteria bacterium]
MESARPASPAADRYDQAVDERIPARLWQDPFKAVYTRPGSALDAASGQHSIRQAIQKESYRAVGEGTQVVLLAVMVSPGSYAELEERRRRRRYAVLSALGESGFAPRDAEALGVFTLGGDSTATAQSYVPYEWYDYERRSPGSRSATRSVVVLWLDESKFEADPFPRFRRLVSDLLHGVEPGRKRSIKAVVLGPARSGTLRNMVEHRDSRHLKWLRSESGLAGFYIISSTATVATADLLGQRPDAAGGSAQTGRLLGDHFSQSCAADYRRTCLRFLRTIRSDDKLIEQLVAELDRRKIDPAQDNTVVISEWDTYFGRSLPRAFAYHYCGDPEGCPHLLRYTYQRGIDGITVRAKEGSAADERPREAAEENVQLPFADATGVRRPVGTGQFDYLRRLAAHIGAEDRELRLGTGRGVRAVAILGSDVYDKLLILRALRHQLPGAVWLTTDLDAHLLHPAEFKWTRNLVVASTFGLRLNKDIQKSTPPFRDSYQTSVYLATRLAVDGAALSGTSRAGAPNDADFGKWALAQDAFYQRIPPQLFEVGRHGAVPLRQAKPNGENINHVIPASFALPIAVGVFLVAGLGVVAVHQMRPTSGRHVAALGLLLLSLIILTVIASYPEDEAEPLSWTAGVSVWPTEYIRLVAVFLTFSFIWSVVNRLRSNWHSLKGRYFGSCAGESEPDGGVPRPAEEVTLRQLMQRIRLPRGRPEPWILLSLALVPLVIAAMLGLRKFDFGVASRLIAMTAVWGLLIVFWWLAIMGKIWPSIRVRSVNQWVASAPESSDPAQLWSEYGRHGLLKHRVLRTLAYLLLYMAFAFIVVALLGRPDTPCRGLACSVDFAIIIMSVLPMLFLLFLVVDAARLCVCWIQKLRERPFDWNRTDGDKLPSLPRPHFAAWMSIHLIGERTGEVTRLVYYPVLVILLLLLARSTYFDDWGFPQALAVIIGVNFLIALGAAVRLNYVARAARSEILDELRREQLSLTASESGEPVPKPSRQEVRELIDQLGSLQIGAYQRIWEQPTVRATVLLLGGIGITFSEYLPGL